MANIDHDRKRVSAVILLYGPAGAGKGSTLYSLARILPPGTHGKVQPLTPQDNRLLRLDYRPHETDQAYGYQLNYRLVGAPGAADVDLLRPVIGAADALLFVADSSPGAMQGNVKALEILDKLVRGTGRQLADVPLVFLYNKRDLRDAVEIRTLEERLNPLGCSYVAASALRGQGVMEAVQRLTATVAVDVRKELQSVQQGLAGSNARTTPHGADFALGRALHDAGGDDRTSLTAQESETDYGGDDDRTEVNPEEAEWGDVLPMAEPVRAEPARPAASPVRSGGHRSVGRNAGQGTGAFQSPAGTGSFSSPAGTGSFSSPAGARRAPAPQPVVGEQQWRTPEELAEDVDADDRTSPYMDGDQMFAEEPIPEPQPLKRPSGVRLSGGAPPPRAQAPPQPPPQPPPQAPPAVAPARARVGSPAPAAATKPRRIDPPAPPAPQPPAPAPARPMRAGPSPTATGQMRSMGGLRGGNVEPWAQQDPGEQAASSTMTINALGREPEGWEGEVERSGHAVRVAVNEMSGYVVTRIGTPRASSRRTIRLPVRVTHMDTLVPQDVVLELDFRLNDGPVATMRAPEKAEPRGVPLVWIVGLMLGGALLIGLFILIASMN